MVAESEVLKAQNCALSKFSLPLHTNEEATGISEFTGKEIISEAIAITPSVQHYEYIRLQGNSFPQVTFLDSPKGTDDNCEPEQENLVAKKPRRAPLRCSSSAETTFLAPNTTGISNWRRTDSIGVYEQAEIEPQFANYSSYEVGHLFDTESGQHV